MQSRVSSGRKQWFDMYFFPDTRVAHWKQNFPKLSYPIGNVLGDNAIRKMQQVSSREGFLLYDFFG